MVGGLTSAHLNVYYKLHQKFWLEFSLSQNAPKVRVHQSLTFQQRQRSTDGLTPIKARESGILIMNARQCSKDPTGSMWNDINCSAHDSTRYFCSDGAQDDVSINNKHSGVDPGLAAGGQRFARASGRDVPKPFASSGRGFGSRPKA